jgi:hypothetical protein
MRGTDVYEVHITKTYLVEAKEPIAARAMANLAEVGGTQKYEFGGIKITTLKTKRKNIQPIDTRWSINRKKETQYAKKAAKRTDRSVGKEQDYVDFGEADHI